MPVVTYIHMFHTDGSSFGRWGVGGVERALVVARNLSDH